MRPLRIHPHYLDAAEIEHLHYTLGVLLDDVS